MNDGMSQHQDTPNFDPLAKIYCWMEYLSFGPMLERCRFRFLRECAGARHALILGDGDGRFTAQLLRVNPYIRIDAIDASAGMLAELRRRARQKIKDSDQRLRTIHADLRSFAASRIAYDLDRYDLVVSHFFLDCLMQEEVEALVRQTIVNLTPNACWLISEFSIPEHGWRRVPASALIRSLYFAFDKMTHLHVRKIPDYAKALTTHGFHARTQARSMGGLLAAEIWDRNIPPVAERPSANVERPDLS